jgi:hypothetical protein
LLSFPKIKFGHVDGAGLAIMVPIMPMHRGTTTSMAITNMLILRDGTRLELNWRRPAAASLIALKNPFT